jgi:hypothetical protein
MFSCFNYINLIKSTTNVITMEKANRETKCEVNAIGTKRMSDIVPEIDFTTMHGNVFGQCGRSDSMTRSTRSLRLCNMPKKDQFQLKEPIVVSECDEDARGSYERTMKAHEYMDEPETLQLKVKKLAELIMDSKRCVAYTGAGLSTGAGIGDYASRGNSNSVTSSLTQNQNNVNRKELCLVRVIVCCAHCTGKVIYQS